MNGMFVRSIQPKRPGTILSFEFRLGEDMSLIQGQAEVAWRRPTTEGPDQPAGMGVRFLKIDMRSRELIKRLVKEHTMRKMLAEGIEVEPPTPKRVAKPVEAASDLAAAAEVVTEALQPALTTDAPVEAAPDFPVPAPQLAETSDHGSKAPLLVGVIGAGLLLALALAYWLPQRGVQPVAEELPVPDRTEPVEVVAVVETSDPTPELPEVFEATPAIQEAAPIGEPARIVAVGSGDLSRVEPTVLAWAQAWSGQRVDEYLGFYANEFAPSDGSSRDDWEKQRFNRLRKPAWIKVELDGLRQQPIGADRVSVTFSQAFLSDTFSDSVTKTLELVWEDGAWKITSENSS